MNKRLRHSNSELSHFCQNEVEKTTKIIYLSTMPIQPTKMETDDQTHSGIKGPA